MTPRIKLKPDFVLTRYLLGSVLSSVEEAKMIKGPFVYSESLLPNQVDRQAYEMGPWGVPCWWCSMLCAHWGGSNVFWWKMWHWARPWKFWLLESGKSIINLRNDDWTDITRDEAANVYEIGGVRIDFRGSSVPFFWFPRFNFGSTGEPAEVLEKKVTW